MRNLREFTHWPFPHHWRCVRCRPRLGLRHPEQHRLDIARPSAVALKNVRMSFSPTGHSPNGMLVKQQHTTHIWWFHKIGKIGDGNDSCFNFTIITSKKRTISRQLRISRPRLVSQRRHHGTPVPGAQKNPKGCRWSAYSTGCRWSCHGIPLPCPPWVTQISIARDPSPSSHLHPLFRWPEFDQ